MQSRSFGPLFQQRATVKTALIALLILGWLYPPPLAAHSLFIQSGRYEVQKGKGSPLFFCYGHHFPVDEGVRSKKLASVRVIDPDGVPAEIQLRDEKSLHSYEIVYDKPGTYVLTAETSPGYFAMYTDKDGRKRHSLKPLHTFAANAESVQTSMRSSQWAKTYVVSAEPSEPFPAAVGLPLELAPEQDPAGLREGDVLRLRVFSEGVPFRGEGYWDATYGGFSTEAEDMYLQRTAVSGGAFSVPLDAGGRWFVRFFTKTDAPEDRRNDYLTEKRTTTLTFMVRNERRRPKMDGH